MFTLYPFEQVPISEGEEEEEEEEEKVAATSRGELLHFAGSSGSSSRQSLALISPPLTPMVRLGFMRDTERAWNLSSDTC